MAWVAKLPRIKRQFLLLFSSACVFSGFMWVSFHQSSIVQESAQWADLNIFNKTEIDINEDEEGFKSKTDNGTIIESTLGKEETGSIFNVAVNEEAGEGKSKVVILMWSKYYEVKNEALMRLMTRGKDYDQKCCEGVELTLDRGQVEKASAIVIFQYFGNLNMSDLPKSRRPDQPWVLFGKESPRFSPNLSSFNKLFNWTMTYRKDSDIFAPYGEYLQLDKEMDDLHVNDMPIDDFVANKTKLLAGVISHCPTPGKREEFAKQLRIDGNMTVDIFGACGKEICGRLNKKCDHDKWWAELAAKYKFYFAAENAICTDYITEKFWRTLQIGMVPLVYGGADYSRFAPPHSYIDVKDFKSVKAVGEYLKKLDKDQNEYKKYFEWRKKYQVRMGEGWQGWCDLCKKVKDFREELDKNDNPLVLEAMSHTIDDLGRWWSHKAEGKEGACDNPPFKYNVTKIAKHKL